MARLTLEFHAGRRDVRLARTRFHHTRLQEEVYQGQEVTASVGHRGCQWRRGLQAVMVFLLRCRAGAALLAPGADAPEPPFAGRRPSLAATLNDLVTQPTNSVNAIFGRVHDVSLFPELVRRENPDFNTDRDAEVKNWLRRDQLAPEDITVVVGDRLVDDPLELQGLIENIEAQWKRIEPACTAPRPALSPEWSELFQGLEAATDFGEVDAAWGRIVRRLLSAASLPEGDEPAPNCANAGRWGLLCECLLDARHGRWSQILKKLRGRVQATMDEAPLSPADAIWSGRAANQIVQAALRLREEATVLDFLAWGKRIWQQFSATALRAQWFHYRARFHWRRRYRDLELAGHELGTARQLYESLPADSPWQQVGLSQVLDSLGEYRADVGDAAGAESAFRESIRLKRILGDRYGEALSHGRLGRLFLEMHDLERAETELLADLDRSRQAHDARSESIALNNLAEVFLLAAESGPADRRDHLDRAASHLDDSLAISRRRGNRVGEGLALVGRARVLLLADSGPHDLRRALVLAGEGERILAHPAVRPEWKRYAQLWSGWARARLATAVQELEQVDRRWFQPAIEDLRAAGLQMDLSEALFQRARMLASEGRRLGAALGGEIADTLCQAVQHARLVRVPALARRYLEFADCVDAATWVDVLLAHKRSLAEVTAGTGHWHAVVEDRCHALSLVLAELDATLRPAPARGTSPLDPATLAVSTQQSVEIARERLHRLERVLGLLQHSSGGAGRITPGLAIRLQDANVADVVREACRSFEPGWDLEAYIKVDVDAGLSWKTFPDLLEIVVESTLRCASQLAAARGACPCASRLLVRAVPMNRQLWIEVLASGSPEAPVGAGVSVPEGGGADRRSVEHNAGPDFSLARHFAHQLNGDIHLVPDPQAGWDVQLRSCFEPLHRDADSACL